MISAIAPGEITRLWPLYSDGIENCLEKGVGKWTAADVLEMAESGAWLIFVVHEGDQVRATIVANIESGKDRILEVGMAWGEGLAEWTLEVHDCMMKVARELNCKTVTVTGRRGWAKHLQQYGFKEKMITMARSVNG